MLIVAPPASAHPMGNFSINHYTRMLVGSESVAIDYVLDFAEIPTFQMFTAKGNPAFVDLQSELDRLSQEWLSQLSLTMDGPRPLRISGVESQELKGAGGLAEMRVVLHLESAGRTSDTILEFQDGNYPDRIGWREVLVVSDGSVRFPNGNRYATDRSQALTAYPADPLVNAPDERQVAIRVAPALDGGSAGGKVKQAMASLLGTRQPGSAEPDRLTAILQSPQLAAEVVLTGLLLAFALGAMHAMSPGHGKTIVAAYLVGNRGTAKHAVFLGAVVTFSHTIGVFVLGLITLFASQYIVPEKLYPWIGFASGLMIVSIGAGLFKQRLKRLHPREEGQVHDHGDGAHSHAHGHSHTHSHAHTHGGSEHTHEIPDRITLRSLVTLGVSGGIVPCPSALVVLLSAVALHRIQFGLLLIVAFSLGLACVLVAVGMLVIRARAWLSHFGGSGRLVTVMPLVSAVIITIIGLGVSLQSIRGFGL